MREFFRTVTQRLAALFRRRRLEDDLDEELRSHLEMAVELNLRKGMSAEEARREALRSFGGVEQTKETYRDQRGLPMIETTLQDGLFSSGNPVPDFGHRRQCRRLQLGRGDLIPAVPVGHPPGATVCSYRNGARRGPYCYFLAGSPRFAARLHAD